MPARRRLPARRQRGRRVPPPAALQRARRLRLRLPLRPARRRALGRLRVAWRDRRAHAPTRPSPHPVAADTRAAYRRAADGGAADAGAAHGCAADVCAGGRRAVLAAAVHGVRGVHGDGRRDGVRPQGARVRGAVRARPRVRACGGATLRADAVVRVLGAAPGAVDAVRTTLLLQGRGASGGRRRRVCRPARGVGGDAVQGARRRARPVAGHGCAGRRVLPALPHRVRGRAGVPRGAGGDAAGATRGVLQGEQRGVPVGLRGGGAQRGRRAVVLRGAWGRVPGKARRRRRRRRRRRWAAGRAAGGATDIPAGVCCVGRGRRTRGNQPHAAAAARAHLAGAQRRRGGPDGGSRLRGGGAPRGFAVREEAARGRESVVGRRAVRVERAAAREGGVEAGPHQAGGG